MIFIKIMQIRALQSANCYKRVFFYKIGTSESAKKETCIVLVQYHVRRVSYISYRGAPVHTPISGHLSLFYCLAAGAIGSRSLRSIKRVRRAGHLLLALQRLSPTSGTFRFSILKVIIDLEYFSYFERG